MKDFLTHLFINNELIKLHMTSTANIILAVSQNEKQFLFTMIIIILSFMCIYTPNQ